MFVAYTLPSVTLMQSAANILRGQLSAVLSLCVCVCHALCHTHAPLCSYFLTQLTVCLSPTHTHTHTHTHFYQQVHCPGNTFYFTLKPSPLRLSCLFFQTNSPFLSCHTICHTLFACLPHTFCHTSVGGMLSAPHGGRLIVCWCNGSARGPPHAPNGPQ